MKFLLDMNLQERWIPYLADLDIPAVHWSSLGLHNSPDEEILQYARATGYVVLTQDLDFGIILALTHQSGPSVIQLRSKDVRPETIGGSVALAVHNLQEELVRGALLTIQPKKIRYTLLPIP